MAATEAFADITAIADQPAAAEHEIAREEVNLLTHEMLLTADSEMAIVRIFGKTSTAVHVGTSPERAMRIGAAFIRAALRIKPQLRMVLVEVDEGKPVLGGIQITIDSATGGTS